MKMSVYDIHKHLFAKMYSVKDIMHVVKDRPCTCKYYPKSYLYMNNLSPTSFTFIYYELNIQTTQDKRSFTPLKKSNSLPNNLNNEK